MSATVSGTRLSFAQPSDIEFLSKLFTNLEDVLSNKDGDREWRGLYSVKNILSEALSVKHILLEAPDSLKVQSSSQESKPDSDVEDDTWVEDWTAEKLLEWMLLEAREAGLPEEKCELSHLIKQLKRRLASIRSTSSKSRPVYGEPAAQPSAVAVRREPEEDHQSNFTSLIPTEIFCKIFEEVCAPRSTTLFSPLILSHVNSHFRSIVLNMPHLWSTIDDVLPFPIAKLYIERSAEAPLDLRLGSFPLARHSSKMLQFFRCLEAHSHRIRILKVLSDDWDTFQLLEELFGPKLHLVGLESWEFRFVGHSRPRDRELMCPTLRESPSLREVHLWGHALELIGAFPTTLRLLQLGKIARLSFAALMLAMKRLPDLNTLVLEDCGLSGSPETVVTAASLVGLQFVRILPIHARLFASHVDTPALSSLSAIAPSKTTDADLLLSLAKKNPQLLSLAVCGYSPAGGNWLSLFKNLPNLHHLRIRASYSLDQDLHGLTLEGILPKLKSITLDNELGLTTQLVEQMAQAHPDLDSIVLRGWDPSNVSRDSLAAVGELVKTMFVETFRKTPEEDFEGESESDASDWDEDSDSDGSWLSGDEYIAKGE